MFEKGFEWNAYPLTPFRKLGKTLGQFMMRRAIGIAAAATMMAMGTPASAQLSHQAQPGDILDSILGTLFGGRAGSSSTLDAQWASGQTPLRNQQYQFETRVDDEIRSGSVDQATGTRLKADYSDLVQLEARYASDGQFTNEERADLSDRYRNLTQALADRGRAGPSSTLDAQWASGQTPLRNQQYQFETRVDNEVRSRSLNQATGNRLKSDYSALVQLEANYAADGRFTNEERADLSGRNRKLTQVLANRGYGDGAAVARPETAKVAEGRTEFNNRVDAAVSGRRITRAKGTRLKLDYASVIQIEATYLRDGVITAAERNDLDTRLDALDARLGDVSNPNQSPTHNLTPRERLDAVARELPRTGLSRIMQAQLLVELGDLTRLADVYSRVNVTADEKAYLDRRLTDVETRSRLHR